VGDETGEAAPPGRSAAPPPPPAAAAYLGDRLAVAVAYADLLATDGVLRGLIGPREVPRLWDRHLLNCAAVGPGLPRGAKVADLGSGAGLPGLVVALLRPDLEMTLLEPLLRRATFLTEAVAALGLANVRVLRCRAEEHPSTAGYDVVLARAVAPLDRLAGWALPLLREGGRLLALKGVGAPEELEAAAPALAALGATSTQVLEHQIPGAETPTIVVEVVAGRRRNAPRVPAKAPAPRARAVSRGTRRPTGPC
jgi:16S rRNA (guanine527-N7)-methyltransferase